ncbi:hypothetical protein [Polyangium fumosum]|uniref:SRCR domain-containing protein n=1 Tax=Polyangium fumosum TaxID=889272 RepID=A0A4U1JLN8_9BACT|nr:hypothetical protein [Polyangium fumosum]TKD13040.1 hypothetical protein E8A74_00325 [Polyangium fumosum]
MLGVAVALVAGALVAGACGVAPEDASLEEENVASYSAAATCETCEPGDPPPPTCTPKCTGKVCGASNGCGGKCASGSCPAGTTCGGGGVYAQCGCTPQCSGQACGAPDGCGGICTGGSCAYGQACGAAGVPGQCATLPTGQGVECFVFNDGYADMVGPSQAIYLESGSGRACVPDGTPGGTCRKWFGRCQTTDPSHTPVYFNVFNDGEADMAGPSDAVFSPGRKQACVPGNGAAGICRRWFGEATLPDGRSVECKLFDDGGAQKTKFTEHAIYNHGYGDVCFPDGSTHGLCRKWFGECRVAGCGDGACNSDETPSSCPSDCKCGDGLCNGSEWCGSCSQDCGGCCGNGVCNTSVGESCSTCPSDCGGTCCGNGTCDNGETCGSCQQDCGACPVPTCSGQPAGSQAQYFTVGIENYWGCLLQANAFYANSLSEAVQCGQAAFPGYNIVTGNVGTYTYNTGNVNGCADITFAAMSSSKAASCANANGYPYAGPCP